MKQLMKTILTSILTLTLLFSLISCGAMPQGPNADPSPSPGGSYGDALNGLGGAIGSVPDSVVGDESMPGEPTPGEPDQGDDTQPNSKENPFVSVDTTPTSTFSADVDTASFTLLRKMLNEGMPLDYLSLYGGYFRSEEFINYFRYTANAPEAGELFGTTASFSPCPWNEENVLMYLTLQAEVPTERLANNLVFLIDVSGSMASSNKLTLLKQSFSYLIDNLAPDDLVSIVTYSGKEQVVLTGCPACEKETILSAINSLVAKGSTNGEAGLEKAYQIAQQYYIEGGNNRIIMASDGDLNVGISSTEELEAYISDKRNEGVFLSVLGFGTGNYQDAKMETLANKGNGAYYYIDSLNEAEKVFTTDLTATLYTVGKDVKLQLTFGADYVDAWRLIGYENRVLDNEDFEDDTKDAGEVGAGHQVTVCYELRLREGATPEAESELASLSIRYKAPDEDVSRLTTHSLTYGESGHTEADRAWIAALIQLAMYLNNSSYLPDGGSVNMNTLYAMFESGVVSPDSQQMTYRIEFLELLAQYVSDPNK